MCMITVMSHGQRPGRAFSNISKCSIIGTGGIQPWDTGHRYHLSWRLWQPNLTECPQNQGKTSYLIFRQTKLETKLRLFYHSLTSFMVFCHLMGDILYHSKTLNQKEFFFSKAVYLYFRVMGKRERVDILLFWYDRASQEFCAQLR